MYSIRKEERELASGSGIKIVLTASATEMSDFFNNPFIAFVAGFGKGPFHLHLLEKHFIRQWNAKPDGQSKVCTLRLKKSRSNTSGKWLYRKRSSCGSP